MAVHNFRAVDIVASHWNLMDAFPRDGTVVEVQLIDGTVVKACWADDKVKFEGDGPNTSQRWRSI